MFTGTSSTVDETLSSGKVKSDVFHIKKYSRNLFSFRFCKPIVVFLNQLYKHWVTALVSVRIKMSYIHLSRSGRGVSGIPMHLKTLLHELDKCIIYF